MSSNQIRNRSDQIHAKRMRKSGFERTHVGQSLYRPSLEYKLAETHQELEAAFRLVYRSYVEVGFQAPNDSQLRFTKHHFLPNSLVFVIIKRPPYMSGDAGYLVSCKEPDVVGTVTLVYDSELGLPMEAVCGPTVEVLRKGGRKPAELMALTMHPDYRGINNTMRLFRLASCYGYAKGVTDLGISVLQRHAPFYCDTIMFNRCGDPKTYAAGNGVQAQGLMLDLTTWDERLQKMYGHLEFDANLAEFFKKGRDEPLRSPKMWSVDMLNYFLRLNPFFLASLSDADREVLLRINAKAGRTLNI